MQILIVPEEGWFGQPKYSNLALKRNSTLYRSLLLWSFLIATTNALNESIWLNNRLFKYPLRLKFFGNKVYTNLAPVGQKANNSIQRINWRHPARKMY